MQNNFEKQVQEKMDALRYQPSAPVWENIEARIRERRKRRRVVFWLPLLAILLAGGLWLCIGIGPNTSKRIAYEKEITSPTKEATKEKVSTEFISNGDKATKSVGRKKDGVISSITSSSISTSVELVKTKSGNHEEARRKNKITDKVSSEKSVFVKTSTPAVKDDIATNSSSSEKKSTPKKPSVRGSSRPENNQINGSIGNAAKKYQTNSGDPLVPENIRFEKATDTAHQKDTLRLPVIVSNKTKGARKKFWSFGLSLTGGISGVGKGLDFSSLDKSYDALTQNSVGTPQAPGSVAAPIEKGLAVSFDLIAKKQLTDRVSFMAGLGYHLFSTNVTVGQFLMQDTVSFTGTIVRQFYQGGTAATRNYTNYYHLISLPISLEWRVHKKLPLFVEGGLGLQYMVSSNALTYDDVKQIFYREESGFSNMQLFLNTSIHYTIAQTKGISIDLGPQLQYGLTTLEKSNGRNHLMSLGVNARLFLKR